MIKVLQVIGGLKRRGAETMLMNIYRGLDKSNIQFDFLVYDNNDGDYDQDVINMGGRIIKVIPPEKAGFIRAINNIRTVIKQYGPYNAIHAHTLHNSGFSMYAAKIENIPIRICHSHNTNTNDKDKIQRRIYIKIMEYLINTFATEYLACGNDAGYYLFGEKFYFKGIVIHNCINSDSFIYSDPIKIIDIKNKFNINDGTITIGSIARFDQVKNHNFMIEIAKELRNKNVNFILMLVGDGTLKKEILKKVKELDLMKEVIFLGVRDDINILINVFNVFLMPSHYEGLPVTLVEAQAAGVQCLISDNITDEVDMGIGLVHYCSIKNNANYWADKIVELSKLKKPEKELIKQKIILKGYDSECLKQRIMELYGKV